LIASTRLAFAQFSRQPFPFVWSSIIYVVLQLLFLFSCIGLFLIYFFVASVLGVKAGLNTIPTMIVLGIIVLLLLFFSNGLNAGLMKSYHGALEGRKTTVAEFLRHSLSKSLVMMVIMLLRDVAFLLVAAPAAALYYFFLAGITYMDYLTGLYILFVLFFIHFLFTPAFISAGTFGTEFIQSLKNGFYFLRRNHINAFGLYILFAIIWILNFVPLLQLATILAVYPIVYSGLILMFQAGHQR